MKKLILALLLLIPSLSWGNTIYLECNRSESVGINTVKKNGFMAQSEVLKFHGVDCVNIENIKSCKETGKIKISLEKNLFGKIKSLSYERYNYGKKIKIKDKYQEFIKLTLPSPQELESWVDNPYTISLNTFSLELKLTSYVTFIEDSYFQCNKLERKI